ncbi:MAG: TlpA disulfide reductase family protein [Mediterranea sp.]|nr:TlpA disulfide reductase family protein [Mediterranea sp.]
MKTVNFLFSLYAVSMMLAACSNPSKHTSSHPEGIVLNLELTGLPDSTEMQIHVGATGQPEEAIQTAYLINGKAQFTFDVEGPRLYNISARHTNGLMNVVMDKGHVATLKAEASYEEQAQGSVPYIRYTNQKVEGTSLQEEYLRRRVNRDALNERYEAYHKITDREEMLKAEKAFFATVDSTFKAAFRASADSWWGPMLILHSYSYINEHNEADYNLLSESAKESFYGKQLHDKIWPPTMVGKQMPDFRFINYANGKAMSLKECLAGKKYLLLDFWASWCKPCRKEIPNILKLYKKYHTEGFEVVSISADTSEAAWKKALDEEKLPWYNDRDGQQGICTLYKVQYYPTIYLIDADGKVVAKDIRGEELAAKLADLFN